MQLGLLYLEEGPTLYAGYGLNDPRGPMGWARFGTRINQPNPEKTVGQSG